MDKLPVINGERAQSYFEKTRSYYQHISTGQIFTGKPLEPVVQISNVQIGRAHV